MMGPFAVLVFFVAGLMSAPAASLRPYGPFGVPPGPPPDRSKLARAPDAASAISPNLILVEVVERDRKTWYKIDEARGARTVEFANSLGARKSRRLDQQNFDRLESEVKGLIGPNNNPRLCMRAYIRVYSLHGEKIGCIGARDRLAVRMKAFANRVGRFF